MHYWTLTFMIICLHGSSAGVTLPECVGPIKAIEIMRDGMTQAATCQNFNQQQTVVWLLIRPTELPLEICTCNSTQCSISSSPFKCSGNSSTSYVELKYPSETLAFDTLALRCKGMTPSLAEDEANCNIDAVYVGTQYSCKTYFNIDDWTVNGECTVSSASSFHQRYACLWTERSTIVQENITEDQTFLNITPLSGNKKFVNFTCGFKKLMPIKNGSLDYSLITYPGGVKRQVTFQGSNSIVFPSQPTTSECDVSNIPENVPYRCNCSTKNIGHPNGRLIWLKGRNSNVNTVVSAGNYSIPFLQMEPQRFLRNESGTQIKCIVNWATNVTGIDHTVTVSYGPDSVFIPENNTFYTDSAGTRNISLTCQAIGVQPETNLIFSWTGLCYGITNKTCTIRPRPPSGNETDIVNTTVNCRIINPQNNNVFRDSSVLNLKYPPSQAPVLSGYEKDMIVYAGDILNITCTITGGQPVVTSTFLKCLDQNKSTDGQINNLSFRLVSTNTSSIECICTGTWGFLPSIYTLNSTLHLIVSYAPSVPMISRNVSQRFPYIEGDTVNLFCNIEESWGNPPSELRWVDQSDGQVGNKSHPATLQLNSVGVKDNNKSITCQATNMYTTHKHLDIKNNTILQVYYRPIILLKKGSEIDACELTSDPWQCVINAGHRVDIECFATSNPPPENITWTMGNETHLSNYSGPRLTITSAFENGAFKCSVTTEKPNVSDDRLPLSSTIELKIIVTKIKLAECSTEKWVQIHESAFDYNFTCKDFLETEVVVWTVITLNASIQAGVCNPNGTCISMSSTFLTYRNNVGESQLRITESNMNRHIYSVQCALQGDGLVSSSCQFDVIYPAEVASCSLNTSSIGWQVAGWCTITKVFSSAGNYTCQWYSDISKASPSTLLSTSTYAPTNHTNYLYRQGSCNFTADLQAAQGNYFYRGVIFPGATSKDLGSITINTPSDPSINTCVPDHFVLAGHTMTCNCSTSYIGQPKGRLQWLSNNNTILQTGNYGDKSLTITTPGLSQNDQGLQFKCQVDWIQVSKQAVHIVTIGYQSSIVNLTLDGTAFSLTVKESSSNRVHLLCETRGRPSPEIRLRLEGQRELIRQIGGNMENDFASLSFNVSTKCESMAAYVCVADNGLGTSVENTVTLYVQCSPRLISVNNTQGYPSVNFKGVARNLTFNIISNPLPHKFSFQFIGTTNADNLIMKPAPGNLFEINCKSSEIISANVKCVLTVNNVKQEDEGFYEAVLINIFGEERIKFRVLFNASESIEMDTDRDKSDSSALNTTVVAASVAAVVIVVLLTIIAILVLVMRRKRIMANEGLKNCGLDGSRPERQERNRKRTKTSISETKLPVMSWNEQPSNRFTGTYDSLNIQDAGNVSAYEDINTYNVCSEPAMEQRFYENSDPDYVEPVTCDHSV